MADIIPKEVKKEVIDGWLNETWKACLLTNAFTYVSGNHVFYSNLVSSEVVGSGYTAGGKEITKLPWDGGSGYVETTNATLDGNDIAWSASTLSNVRYIAIYEDTTVAKKIRAIYQFTADKSVTNGTITIIWNSGGLIKIM